MHFHAFPKAWGQKPLACVPSRQELFISCGGYAASFPASLGTVRMQLKGKRTRIQGSPLPLRLRVLSKFNLRTCARYRRSSGRFDYPRLMVVKRSMSHAMARRPHVAYIHKLSANCKFNMLRIRTFHIFRHYLDPFPRINRTYVTYVSAALGVPWASPGRPTAIFSEHAFSGFPSRRTLCRRNARRMHGYFVMKYDGSGPCSIYKDCSASLTVKLLTDFVQLVFGSKWTVLTGFSSASSTQPPLEVEVTKVKANWVVAPDRKPLRVRIKTIFNFNAPFNLDLVLLTAFNSSPDVEAIVLRFPDYLRLHKRRNTETSLVLSELYFQCIFNTSMNDFEVMPTSSLQGKYSSLHMPLHSNKLLDHRQRSPKNLFRCSFSLKPPSFDFCMNARACGRIPDFAARADSSWIWDSRRTGRGSRERGRQRAPRLGSIGEIAASALGRAAWIFAVRGGRSLESSTGGARAPGRYLDVAARWPSRPLAHADCAHRPNSARTSRVPGIRHRDWRQSPRLRHVRAHVSPDLAVRYQRRSARPNGGLREARAPLDAALFDAGGARPRSAHPTSAPCTHLARRRTARELRFAPSPTVRAQAATRREREAAVVRAKGEEGGERGERGANERKIRVRSRLANRVRARHPGVPGDSAQTRACADDSGPHAVSLRTQAGGAAHYPQRIIAGAKTATRACSEFPVLHWGGGFEPAPVISHEYGHA
ncbi:hypothetical protein DFH06DRAFT_1378754 [Mycena polygramma]|nr:hypothetical protein DFH06DRAFT_1378754 [Mycena polygramma]